MRARIFEPGGEAASPEFAVNSYSEGDQQFPSVAAGADGFVVVWQSQGQDGSGFGVYGQRFDLSGARAGGEFQVSSQARSQQFASRVAMDQGGRFVVAFSSNLEDLDHPEDVWARAYRSDGTPYGPQFLVNSEQRIYQQLHPSVALSDSGVFMVAYDSWRQESQFVWGHDVMAWRFALPCEADERTLCLQDGRFLVRAFFTPPEGESALARAIPLTRDSGGFWFFAPDNFELLIKVLDGCGVNGNFWLYAAGLTDREVQLLVTDTWTGQVRSFHSAGGNPLQPIQELGLFPGCGVPPPAGAPSIPTGAPASRATPLNSTTPALGTGPGAACQPSEETVCLGGGRFRVRAAWREFRGLSGAAQGLPLGERSALFWFFDRDNVELVVKLLDGCSVNERTWIYATALTNVEVTITVEDLETGAIWRHRNPLGQPFPPVQDVHALASCSVASPR